MYVLYLRAYSYLQAYEIVLFTIFTPVYVALLDAALEKTLAMAASQRRDYVFFWRRHHSLETRTEQ